MSTKHPAPLLVAFGLLLSASIARADTARFDQQMKPLYGEYQKIQRALAADSLRGGDSAAQRIVKLAGKLDPSSVSGQHAGHYKNLPANIKTAAQKLAKARGIAAKREAFKDLSKPFAMWATMSRPKGIKVLYCSMAKGSWLQSEKKTANPYYGAKMLGCGQVVGGEAGAGGGHMGHMGRTD